MSWGGQDYAVPTLLPRGWRLKACPADGRSEPLSGTGRREHRKTCVVGAVSAGRTEPLPRPPTPASAQPTQCFLMLSTDRVE